MKKIIFTALTAVLMLSIVGCKKQKKEEPVQESTIDVEAAKALLNMFEFDDSLAPIVVGNWNDDHSAYIMDLSKITTPSAEDSTLVLNTDGSLDVTFLNPYSQILIPMPVTDHEFMEQVSNVVITVSSDYDGYKKIVWKMSKDPENSWGGAGGPGGQGINCVDYQYRDYEDIWDYTDLTSYYNGDEYSFKSLMYMAGVRALAMCNNTTEVPFTFHIESIYWCK